MSVLLLIAVAVGIVLAGTARSRKTRAVSPSRTGTATQIASVERTQLLAFAVLHAHPEALSATMKATIEQALAASRPLGLNLKLARRVRTSVGVDAWVVPGDGFLCVIRDVTATAGCNTTRETIKDGMSLLETEPGIAPVAAKQYLLLGLVPNGVRSVEAITDAGKSIVVPVHDNVYAYRSAVPVRARLRRPNGR